MVSAFAPPLTAKGHYPKKSSEKWLSSRTSSSRSLKSGRGKFVKVGNSSVPTPELRSDVEEAKSSHRMDRIPKLSGPFHASSALNSTIEALRSLNCLDCLHSSKNYNDLSDCSIPSKVYLADSYRANASSDKSIGGYLVLKNHTFHSVDTTLLSSLPSRIEKNPKECLLLGDDTYTSSRDGYNCQYDDNDLVLQRSVSPLSCPSFGGQPIPVDEVAFASRSRSNQDIMNMKDAIIQTIYTKDSLLSFDVSSTSGALLDMLSIDSDDGGGLDLGSHQNNHDDFRNTDDALKHIANANLLTELCEQSVQSSLSPSHVRTDYDGIL